MDYGGGGPFKRKTRLYGYRPKSVTVGLGCRVGCTPALFVTRELLSEHLWQTPGALRQRRSMRCPFLHSSLQQKSFPLTPRKERTCKPVATSSLSAFQICAVEGQHIKHERLSLWKSVRQVLFPRIDPFFGGGLSSRHTDRKTSKTNDLPPHYISSSRLPGETVLFKLTETKKINTDEIGTFTENPVNTASPSWKARTLYRRK